MLRVRNVSSPVRERIVYCMLYSVGGRPGGGWKIVAGVGCSQNTPTKFAQIFRLALFLPHSPSLHIPYKLHLPTFLAPQRIQRPLARPSPRQIVRRVRRLTHSHPLTPASYQPAPQPLQHLNPL